MKINLAIVVFAGFYWNYSVCNSQRVVSADPCALNDAIQGLTQNLTKLTAETNLVTARQFAATKKRDSRVDSGSLDLETPLELSPKSPEVSSGIICERPVPPPRSKAPSEPTKLPSLPLKKDVKKPVMADEFHDYSEIYTPSQETAWNEAPSCSTTSGSSAGHRADSGDSGLTGLSGGAVTVSEEEPRVVEDAPPLPIHRYPSWEKRIYEVATEGMTQQGEESRFSTASLRGSCYGSDVSVPVYAAVKGVSSGTVTWSQGNNILIFLLCRVQVKSDLNLLLVTPQTQNPIVAMMKIVLMDCPDQLLPGEVCHIEVRWLSP